MSCTYLSCALFQWPQKLEKFFFFSFVILHYVSHFNSELVAKSAVFSCIYIHLVYCVMGIMRMILICKNNSHQYNYCKTRRIQIQKNISAELANIFYLTSKVGIVIRFIRYIGFLEKNLSTK